MLKKLLIGLAVFILLIAAAVTAMLWFQGQREIDTSGEYVALGSSYAAGARMGEALPDSPTVCGRTDGSYPAKIAQKLQVDFVSNACGGSTTAHILHGGQVFLGPQIDAVGPNATLVTITSGGNDVNFVGDLMMMSDAMGPVVGFLNGVFGSAEPASLDARPFAKVQANLIELVQESRRRAPKAQIVLVSYPRVLPPRGTCAAIGLTEDQADLMRQVEDTLAAETAAAAAKSGALLVDMHALGSGHDACSVQPWISGKASTKAAPSAFHPTQAGTQATADAVLAAVKNNPSVRN